MYSYIAIPGWQYPPCSNRTRHGANQSDQQFLMIFIFPSKSCPVIGLCSVDNCKCVQLRAGMGGHVQNLRHTFGFSQRFASLL